MHLEFGAPPRRLVESWSTGRGYAGKVLAEVLKTIQQGHEVGKVARKNGIYQGGQEVIGAVPS